MSGYGDDRAGGYGGDQGSRIGGDASFGQSGMSDNYGSSSTGDNPERQGNDYADSSNERSSSTGFGSGATSGTGFGNKSTAGMGDQTSLPADYGTDNREGSQLTSNADPYSGSNDYGSGTTGGAGFGNKSSGDDPSLRRGEGYGGNPDLARSSDPYSGSRDYGSGTTGGAGFGNKSTGASDDSASGGDSTAGKLMSKIGGVMGNKNMEQKGMEKREQAGYGGQSSDY